MTVRLCDELPFGFGWISPEPQLLERASHALVDEGHVWLVDPVDFQGLDDRVQALGEPAGVIRLIDRHGRDCAALARRYGVPLHHVPREPVPGSPFDVVRTVDVPGWREASLWWPERSVLVVGDALGTAAYFLGPGEQLAVHPFLRLLPPRRLARLAPAHILCGHGEGIHGEGAPAALHDALRSSRRGIPRWLGGLVRNRGKRRDV